VPNHTRPAQSDERVQLSAAVQVELKLKTQFQRRRTGTEAMSWLRPLGATAPRVVMSPLEFLQPTDRKIYPPQAALHRTIWPFSRSPVPV